MENLTYIISEYGLYTRDYMPLALSISLGVRIFINLLISFLTKNFVLHES